MRNVWSEAELAGGPPSPTEVTPAGIVAGTVIGILLVLIAIALAVCVAVLGSSSAECCAALGVAAILGWCGPGGTRGRGDVAIR
jgi:hypothetical protein